MEHAAISVFLKRIGKREIADCWWYEKADQSIDHLYIKCREWRKERKVLKRKLKKREIEWQCQPESRLLANLLANKQAVSPLLNYLMSTDIGDREGERERVAEKNQRIDQKDKE